jgi:HD-GYP domain-containing protein (c-di-GMP phosphodiesterase class II)
MHDLGKIGIPDEILNKNGKFLPEEYAVMKNHSRLGYEMLSHSKCELLRLAAEIAFSHHERIDGKGYPLGLSGNEIPLAGRICAVADVFDALINVRCYKRPWSREQVIALYQEERGRQFEASLVDILLEHLDEFYAINDSMPD